MTTDPAQTFTPMPVAIRAPNQIVLPAALSETPLLVSAEHFRTFVEGYLQADAEYARAVATRPGQAQQDSPRYRVDGGAAVIPISGALVNRYDLMGYENATSYGAIVRELGHAAASQQVNRIVLAINSPGGSVDGIDHVEDAVRAARSQKPVIAHIAGLGASAAYWIASQADEVLATRLSHAGGIGIYTTHVDVSRAYDQAGVTVSMIASGRHKVDGNPFAPLSAEVRGDMQARVDQLRLTFARSIAAGRGDRLPSDAALATEGRVYDAPTALQHGLIDRIGSLSDAISSPAGRRVFPAAAIQEQIQMTTTPQTPAADAAALAAARAEGRAEGVREGATAERARISAIMAHESAVGRQQTALTLATTTDMSVEQVAAVLVTVPAATAQPQPAASVPTIAQRAAALPQIGGTASTPGQADEAAIAAGWKAAAERVSARIQR